MKTFFKIVGTVFLLFILLVVLVLGYLGFIPGVSNLFGSNRPRDLGVRHTEADLKKAQEKLKQSIVEPKEDPFAQLKESKGNPVDISLTQEEYSAHAERIHPVSDLQIKIQGSSFEISGRLDKSRVPQFLRTWGLTGVSDGEVLDVLNKYLPVDPIFYFAGSGNVKNNDINVDLTQAQFGRLHVSTEQAEEVLKVYTKSLFDQVQAFSVEDSEFKDGKLNFKGSILEEIPKY